METEQINLEEVIARLNLIMLDCKRTDRSTGNADWNKTAFHWQVTIGQPVGGCHTCDDIKTERKGYPKSERHNNHYNNEKTFTIIFSQGKGHVEKQKAWEKNMGREPKPTPPTLRDIIGCVLLDAGSFLDSALLTYEEWAPDYGYDLDSRKGEAVFEACKKQTKDFVTLVGFDRLKELLAVWDGQY